LWILFVAVSLAFWPTYTFWWSRWTASHSPFGYGYLIPPTVLFLIWCRRGAIADAPRKAGHPWILIPILLAVGLHMIALLAKVNIVQSIAFMILLMSLPYFLWGGAVYRYIWGALAYAATMIPWPQQIYSKLLLPSQLSSTTAAVTMMDWMGVYTDVEGTKVLTPNYSFEVAAACSGLTIVFPVVAIVILSTMMINASMTKKLLLLLLAVPLSIFANSVRIVTIALIGEYGGKEMADKLHDPSGIAAVIFATILLTILMSVMKCNDYKEEYMPAFARADEDEDQEEEGTK
jgi:exosortase